MTSSLQVATGGSDGATAACGDNRETVVLCRLVEFEHLSAGTYRHGRTTIASSSFPAGNLAAALGRKVIGESDVLDLVGPDLQRRPGAGSTNPVMPGVLDHQT